MREGKEASQHVSPAFYQHAKSLDTLVSEGIHYLPVGNVLNYVFIVHILAKRHAHRLALSSDVVVS